MAILINKDTKVLVQAITGKSGSLQTKVARIFMVYRFMIMSVKLRKSMISIL